MKHKHYRLGLVPAILVLLCGSGPVRAGEQVPFQGTFVSMDHAMHPDPCHAVVELRGEGQATHLGRFTYTATNIGPSTCIHFPVELWHNDLVTLTAANGDQLFGTGDGTATVDFTDPTRVRIVVEGTLTITGGTGRFAHATGTMRLSGLVRVYEATLLPDGSVLVPAIYALEGTLSSVGSDK